jgi:hypothetical protein
MLNLHVCGNCEKSTIAVEESVRCSACGCNMVNNGPTELPAQTDDDDLLMSQDEDDLEDEDLSDMIRVPANPPLPDNGHFWDNDWDGLE